MHWRCTLDVIVSGPSGLESLPPRSIPDAYSFLGVVLPDQNQIRSLPYLRGSLSSPGCLRCEEFLFFFGPELASRSFFHAHIFSEPPTVFPLARGVFYPPFYSLVLAFST